MQTQLLHGQYQRPCDRGCEELQGTQPLSTSERSFYFLPLFLNFTLTSNILFTYSAPSPERWRGGVGRGSDHHSLLSDLVVNVHDTEYLSSFRQITSPEIVCVGGYLRAFNFDCIPHLS